MKITPTRLAIGLRILIALSTRTFFQPDEFFQSLEPAHHLVFGYGYLTWEWLTSTPIRSIVYPALNVPVYWLLKISGLVDTGVLGNWLLVGTCFFRLAMSNVNLIRRNWIDIYPQNYAWGVCRGYGYLDKQVDASGIGQAICLDCGTLLLFSRPDFG